MLFGSWQNPVKSPNFFRIQLHGKVLERVAKLSYFVVVLGKTFSWKDHVKYVSSKVSSWLVLLTRIQSCFTQKPPRSRYILHLCSRYLTMLMWPGVKSQKDVEKSFSAYKTVQLKLFFEGKLQKTLSVSLTG